MFATSVEGPECLQPRHFCPDHNFHASKHRPTAHSAALFCLPRLPEQLQPRQFAPSRSFYTSEHRPKCEVCSGCSMQLIDISEAPPVDLAEYKLQFHRWGA
eukprot:268896-Pelagomonas_calceolata.AAC.2